MKILVVLSRVPWPLEKGDKLRAYHQIKHLSDNNEIVLCCMNDGPLHPEAISTLEPLCSDLLIINNNRSRILWNLAKGIFSSKPFQVHYFHNPKGQRLFDRFVEKHLPQHIYCQLIRTTEYARKYTFIPKTLDYMDAFSKGMERRISTSPWYKRMAMRVESKRLIAYEKTMYDVFENRTIISEQDKALIHHPHGSSIDVIPNGVDTDFFRPMESEKEYDIAFTGNMSYPPNVDGSKYIVQQIMPHLDKKITTLISGADPALAVRQLASEQITVTGWVKDIRDSYAKARVFVAPMQLGTGLQNKLLEAMAMRIPCVTSALANNALGAKDGESILIGERPEDYARHINDLLNDATLYERIVQNGHQFVKEHFDWAATTAQLNDLMRST